MGINSQATAGSLSLKTSAGSFLKPKARRKLKRSEIEGQGLTEAEAHQLGDLLVSLAQANRQVTERLDNIHQELQEMIAFSRAARLPKE